MSSCWTSSPMTRCWKLTVKGVEEHCTNHQPFVEETELPRHRPQSNLDVCNLWQEARVSTNPPPAPRFMDTEGLLLNGFYHQLSVDEKHCGSGNLRSNLFILLSLTLCTANKGPVFVLSEKFLHRQTGVRGVRVKCPQNVLILYKSPSSSSSAVMPLWRKASFSCARDSDSWSCLK